MPKVSITQLVKQRTLEIEIDGDEYTLTDLNQEQMEEADRVLKRSGDAADGDDPRDRYGPHRQLAFLVGAPEDRFLKLGWQAVNLSLTTIGDWLVARRGDEGKGGSATPGPSRGAS